MKPIHMIKNGLRALTLLLLVAVCTAIGCSKKIEVDTVNLEYSFQTADDATQTAVNEAVEAIETADYNAAVAKLKPVSADPNLTAEQKTAVNDVLQKLENR